MADGLEHACRVPVQTPGLRNLTYAACMPDLTVQEYKGQEACGGEARGHFTIDEVGLAGVRVRKQGLLGAFHTHGAVFLIRCWCFKIQ